MDTFTIPTAEEVESIIKQTVKADYEEHYKALQEYGYIKVPELSYGMKNSFYNRYRTGPRKVVITKVPKSDKAYLIRLEIREGYE